MDKAKSLIGEAKSLTREAFRSGGKAPEPHAQGSGAYG